MNTLREGMVGADVLRWQVFLVGQGMFAAPTTAAFDARTVEATIAFQDKYNLQADGVAGNKTVGQAQMLGFDVIGDPSGTGHESPNWPPRPSTLVPLVTNAERGAVFGNFAYRSAPTPDNPERIEITDDWEQRNIVRVAIPQLADVKGAPATGMIRCHRLIAAQLQSLWAEWGTQGLLPLVKTWDGMFVLRFIRGSTTTLSNHAFGTAFDINYHWNQLGTRPALAGSPGSVRELVPIANKHGFFWGGHFASRPDGMHFEAATVLP